MEKEYPHSELTHQITGMAYKIYNDLKYGLSEKAYQRAFEVLLKEKRVSFEREKYAKITYRGTAIGKYYLDFLIEGKVAIELKVRSESYGKDVSQLLEYIRSQNIPVGLLIVFTKEKVEVKRLANTNKSNQRLSAL